MSEGLHENPEFPEELPYRRVLDHGFVALIDVMGNDASIVQSARVSYGKGTKTVRSDKALISYLMRHRHCYDAETEVLTDEGFVKWPDVRDSMKLGVWDPLAQSLCYEQPGYITHDTYSGPMYRVDHGGVDLLVTPEHKMWVRTKVWDGASQNMRWSSYGLLPAAELGHRSTVSYCKLAPFRGPDFRGGDFPPFQDRDALLKLVGFFVGDGCALGTRANGLEFHLKNLREIGYLGECAARVGWEIREFPSYEGRRKFVVYADQVTRLFRQSFYVDGEKRLPPWALMLNKEDSQSLLDGLRHSDGTEKRGAWELTTKYRTLAEQVQRVALHAGESAHINVRHGASGQMYGVMVMSRMRRPVVNQGRQQTSFEDYSGTIHCAHTRTGILVVRRNGKIVLSGNTTPFEMVEFKFLMRLPVFIARQLVRHRTANINEYSARYSVVPDRFFVPSLGAISVQDTVNRQGRADLVGELAGELPERAEPCAYVAGEQAVLTRAGKGISRAGLGVAEHRAAWLGGEPLPSESYVQCADLLLEHFPERKAALAAIQGSFRENNERCYALYQSMIERGIAREVARCVLPLTMYTEWYWKIDLHNLFHFLKLRMDPHAQLEIRAFAEAMATFVKPAVPYAWESFEEDNLKGTFLSGHEKDTLRPADPDAQREVLKALYEKGYRSRRLKEVCRKLSFDESIVDELWPPS